MTSDQWAYIVSVALPEQSKKVKQWYLRYIDVGDNGDLIRLALERATYDEKTQIMAMVLGAKEAV